MMGQCTSLVVGMLTLFNSRHERLRRVSRRQNRPGRAHLAIPTRQHVRPMVKYTTRRAKTVGTGPNTPRAPNLFLKSAQRRRMRAAATPPCTTGTHRTRLQDVAKWRGRGPWMRYGVRHSPCACRCGWWAGETQAGARPRPLARRVSA